MRHFYYYVPPCPKCGSRKTGRYIRTPYTGSGYTKEASLKAGEWIRFAIEEPVANCFCMTCGNEWPGHVSLKFWPFERIQEERQARGTEEVYQEMLTAKGTGKAGLFDFGRRYRESKMSQTKPKEQPKTHAEPLEPDIIDSRQRDTIELLYTDDDLIEQTRRAQQR